MRGMLPHIPLIKNTAFPICFSLLPALPSALLPELSALSHAPSGTAQTVPRHTLAAVPPLQNPAMRFPPGCPFPAAPGIPPPPSPDYPPCRLPGLPYL